MARQRKEAYGLTDTEKRDLIQRKIPTNADEYLRLQDAADRWPAALDLPYPLRRYYD